MQAQNGREAQSHVRALPAGRRRRGRRLADLRLVSEKVDEEHLESNVPVCRPDGTIFGFIHPSKPPSPEDQARMLKMEDVGRVVRFVAESPAHVCVNEIVVSPTWNRLILGGGEMLLAPKIE